jgi:hypothetical protein
MIFREFGKEKRTGEHTRMGRSPALSVLPRGCRASLLQQLEDLLL